MGGSGPRCRRLLRGIRIPGSLVPLHRPVERSRGRGHGQRRGGRWRRREGSSSLSVGWVLRVLQRPGRLPLEGRVPLLISKTLIAGGPTKGAGTPPSSRRAVTAHLPAGGGGHLPGAPVRPRRRAGAAAPAGVLDSGRPRAAQLGSSALEPRGWWPVPRRSGEGSAARAPFEYEALPSRVVFGVGASDRLAGEVDRIGATRVLVVASRDRAVRLRERLGGRCAGIFTELRQHVPVESAAAARGAAGELDVDCLVACGGGSAVGLAKAVALDRPVPVVALPTTYAGSEMTPVWGLTSGRRKQTGRDPRVAAAVVLYDPALTVSLPARLTASSGMNAVAHCVAALYGPRANPVTALHAEEGLRRLAAGLVAPGWCRRWPGRGRRPCGNLRPRPGGPGGAGGRGPPRGLEQPREDRRRPARRLHGPRPDRHGHLRRRPAAGRRARRRELAVHR